MTTERPAPDLSVISRSSTSIYNTDRSSCAKTLNRKPRRSTVDKGRSPRLCPGARPVNRLENFANECSVFGGAAGVLETVLSVFWEARGRGS